MPKAELKIAKQRLSALQLAEALGSVSEVCRRRGISRTQFYEYKRRFQTHGLEGLKDLPPIHKSHPQTTTPEVVERILELSLSNPMWGCVRLSDQLKLVGISVSSPTIQKILLANDLGSKYQRLLRLEEKALVPGPERLDEIAGRERHGVEGRPPGQRRGRFPRPAPVQEEPRHLRQAGLQGAGEVRHALLHPVPAQTRQILDGGRQRGVGAVAPGAVLVPVGRGHEPDMVQVHRPHEGAGADLALVCFRLNDGRDEAPLNELNRRFLAEINAAGPVFLTHTTLRGKYTLRFVVGQRTTEERHVRAAWDILSAAADEALKA